MQADYQDEISEGAHCRLGHGTSALSHRHLMAGSSVCRRMAVCNLLVSPFLMLFLLIYFFMRNAEKFYHHPSSIGARRWSGTAYWRMREFNELPHYIQHRLAPSPRV